MTLPQDVWKIANRNAMRLSEKLLQANVHSAGLSPDRRARGSVAVLLSPQSRRTLWPRARFVPRMQCFLTASLLVLGFLGIAGTAEAGIIVAVRESSESCMMDAGVSEAPVGKLKAAEQPGNLRGLSQDALPSGTGASGGYSIGISIVAVLDQPRDIGLPQAFSCSLEERRLSLPASPVSERLRPPRA